MKNVKIFAPIKDIDEFGFVKNTNCQCVYADYSLFLCEDNSFFTLNQFIQSAKENEIELFINFKSSIKENEIVQIKSLLKYLAKINVDGILVNSFAILEFIKSQKVPFKIMIDSGLKIHNLSGIDFVSQFQKIENINITEEIYVKNIEKIKKYTKYSLAIDSDNLPWLAEELKRDKTIDAIVIKGVFDSPDELIDAISLIDNIIQKPKIFKNQKLPFRNTEDAPKRTNHFSGEFLNFDDEDFKFSGNIRKYDWVYKKTRLKSDFNYDVKKLPSLNLRLTSLEQVNTLEKYIEKIGFNPVKSIEYGEILSTADLFKGNFNQIIDKVKKFSKQHKIKLNLSTPRILIERDFDRVYEYVKLLFTKKPYPASIVVNNIGFWWAIINDDDYEKVNIELGNGLNLSNSESMLCLATQHDVSAIDLSNFSDNEELEACVKNIGNAIPKKKITIAGNVRIPSSGLCPLNNDSAILSRLSCKAPCHKGNYAISNPEHTKNFPFVVDGFCRMHLYKDKILDMYSKIPQFQKMGVNEFIVDCSNLPTGLIPVLLNRFLNSLDNENYKPDESFITE